MSQRSDDTTKGACCFPALFTDKATRADVKRAFYRISQLEKKINQISKQQEKLRNNESSSKISKKNQKRVTKEKETKDETDCGLVVHAAESVYVKRQEDAPSLITLPCGCVLEKRTLYSASEVESNDKNVPRSLSTCGCGLAECKTSPSLSEQKCRFNCACENSHTSIVEKRSCHSHKGVVNIVTEEAISSQFVPLKTIRSCLCAESNVPQTACTGGCRSIENCLKSTQTASTQTCREYPPRICGDSQMSIRNKCRPTVVCRNRKSKLALGVFNGYNLSETQLRRTPISHVCDDASSSMLLSPNDRTLQAQSNSQYAVKKKSPWGSIGRKRADKNKKKKYSKREQLKNSIFFAPGKSLSSKSSNTSGDRPLNKGKKKKRIQAFVVPMEMDKNRS